MHTFLLAFVSLLSLTSFWSEPEVEPVDFRVQVYPFGGYYSYPPTCPPGFYYGPGYYGRGSGFQFYFGPGYPGYYAPYYGRPGCYPYGYGGYYGPYGRYGRFDGHRRHR